MAKKKKEPAPKRDRNKDLFVVRIGGAGIGHGGFRAYFDGDIIDRSDSDDLHTYDTPGQALAALGREFDIQLMRLGWKITHFAQQGDKEAQKEVRGIKRRTIKKLYEEPEKL